jgi:hypothetical protein
MKCCESRPISGKAVPKYGLGLEELEAQKKSSIHPIKLFSFLTEIS